ncbi:hypothetical protein TGRUB_271950 [Toxoplasma gondii RUB]|uniref:Glutamyl-tRNA(Gln) amidotransferase subunit A n=1 Tax=Toxoplasma gondii RUB TaxID=935652 RepID=A0A086M5J9_TOXGO|nr:hypothetical protein TGRUB_271950 [Toxoplasma gondii RUB]
MQTTFFVRMRVNFSVSQRCRSKGSLKGMHAHVVLEGRPVGRPSLASPMLPRDKSAFVRRAPTCLGFSLLLSFFLHVPIYEGTCGVSARVLGSWLPRRQSSDPFFSTSSPLAYSAFSRNAESFTPGAPFSTLTGKDLTRMQSSAFPPSTRSAAQPRRSLWIRTPALLRVDSPTYAASSIFIPPGDASGTLPAVPSLIPARSTVTVDPHNLRRKKPSSEVPSFCSRLRLLCAFASVHSRSGRNTAASAAASSRDGQRGYGAPTPYPRPRAPTAGDRGNEVWHLAASHRGIQSHRLTSIYTAERRNTWNSSTESPLSESKSRPEAHERTAAGSFGAFRSHRMERQGRYPAGVELLNSVASATGSGEEGNRTRCHWGSPGEVMQKTRRGCSGTDMGIEGKVSLQETLGERDNRIEGEFGHDLFTPLPESRSERKGDAGDRKAREGEGVLAFSGDSGCEASTDMDMQNPRECSRRRQILQGVSVELSDNIFSRNTLRETRRDSPIFPRRLLARDSTIARRLRSAGAKLLGHFPSRSTGRFCLSKRTGEAFSACSAPSSLSSSCLSVSTAEEDSGRPEQLERKIFVGFSPFPQRSCSGAGGSITEHVGSGDKPEAGAPGDGGDTRGGDVEKLPEASLQEILPFLCCFRPSKGAVSGQGIFPSQVSLCPTHEKGKGKTMCESKTPAVASGAAEQKASCENTEGFGEAICESAFVLNDGVETSTCEARPHVEAPRVPGKLEERESADISTGDDAFRPDTLWIAAAAVPTLSEVFKAIAGPDEADLVTQWREHTNQYKKNIQKRREDATEGGSKDPQRTGTEVPSTEPAECNAPLSFSTTSPWLKTLRHLNDAAKEGSRPFPRLVLLKTDKRVTGRGKEADGGEVANFHQERPQGAKQNAPFESNRIGKGVDLLPKSFGEYAPVTEAIAPESYMQRRWGKLDDGETPEVPVVSLHVSEEMRMGLEQMQAAVQVISACESVTNLARFDGMRDAEEENMEGHDASRPYWVSVLRRRSQGFTDEAKECMLAGAYALSQFAATKLHEKALAVRTSLAQALSRVIDESEVLLWVPPAKQSARTEEVRHASSEPAPHANPMGTVGRPETEPPNRTPAAYLGERWMYTAADLLGLPLLQLPCGVTLLGPAGTDRELLEVAQKLTSPLTEARRMNFWSV